MLREVVGSPFTDGATANVNDPAGVSVNATGRFVFSGIYNTAANGTPQFGVQLANLKSGTLTQASGSPFAAVSDADVLSVQAFPTKRCP